MISDWFQRVGSSIPRGFSRYYILELLQKKPHTGKEIIDNAIKESGGRWNPSPGLIYPLLGRLLDENLIEEMENGKYKVSQKGKTTLGDIDSFNDIVKKQLDTIFRSEYNERHAPQNLLFLWKDHQALVQTFFFCV